MKMIANDIIPVVPLSKPNKGLFKLMVTDKPSKFEAGDHGHFFGFGFYIVNEKGKLIFASEDLEEYNRLVKKYF